MRPERTGQHHTINGVRIHFIHQQSRTRIKGRFRKLNGPNIPLGHRNQRPVVRRTIIDHI